MDFDKKALVLRNNKVPNIDNADALHYAHAIRDMLQGSAEPVAVVSEGYNGPWKGVDWKIPNKEQVTGLPLFFHPQLPTEQQEELERLRLWRKNVAEAVSPYLTDDDGSDLMPDYARITNMLERLRKENADYILASQGWELIFKDGTRELTQLRAQLADLRTKAKASLDAATAQGTGFFSKHLVETLSDLRQILEG